MGCMSPPPKSTLGKQLEYLFATASTGAAAHFVVALATWAVLSARMTGDDRVAVNAMLALLTVASLAMWALARRFRRSKLDDAKLLQGFADAHSAIVLFGALVWGMAAFLTVDKSVEVRAFYTLAWAGASMGAVSSQHSSLRSCLISIWGSNPFVAWVYAASIPSFEGDAIAAMILTFGVLLSVLAVRNNRFVRENLQLNQTLSRQLLELEELSHRLAFEQQRAEASERSKSRLMAQASHDFRQPVHAIGIMAECLRDNLTQTENLEMIKRIETSVAALSGMFKSFLDYYALEAGRMHAEQQPLSLQSLLSDLQDDADEMAQGSETVVRVLSNRAWVLSDASMLGAMLRNLVSNAIKYGHGGVLVGCRRRNGALAIEVYDNGRGLNDAEQMDIFDEFVRVVDQQRPTRDGIGLGLSITRRMAELLGLRIRVRSRLGHGSCFSIEGLTLVAPADEPSTGDWRALASVASGKPIQVVEDDDDARQAMAELLQRWGYAVAASADTQGIDAWPLDAVLIVNQSRRETGSGLDVARDWLARGGRHAVLTTGLVDADLRQACQDLGVTLLIKPVAPAQLRSLLLSFERQ